MNIPKIDLVIYHKNCQDGLASAYLVKRHNGSYYPMELYGTNPGKQERKLPNVTGKNVMIVDISFNKETMEQLYDEAKFLICLDHHTSAKKELDGLPFCVFDMSRSACQIVWDILFSSSPRPNYIDFIAGRDLWDFSMPDCKAFSTGFFRKLMAANYKTDLEKFRFFDDFHDSNTALVAKHMNYYIDFGRIELAQVDASVSRICKTAVKCTIKDMTAYAVNTRSYRSDVGNKLLLDHKCQVAVAFEYDLASNAWWVSLRSLKGSNNDVSELAKSIDETGGGHKNASGFTYHGDISKLLVV